MYTEMSFYHNDRQLLPNILFLTPLTIDGQSCLVHDYRLLRPLIATDENYDERFFLNDLAKVELILPMFQLQC